MRKIETSDAWGLEYDTNRLCPWVEGTKDRIKAILKKLRQKGTPIPVVISRKADYLYLLRQARMNPYQPPFEGPIKGFGRKRLLASAKSLAAELPRRKKGGRP